MTDDPLIDALRDALAHLDDLPYLQAHPLAGRLSLVASSPDPSKGQVLRRALRWAIAALDPGSGGSGGRMEARSYWVLYHYAISGQTMSAIAEKLGLSRRQAYRELHRGLEGLARILTDPLVPLNPEAGSTSSKWGLPGSQVQEELERLSWASDRELSLCQLLHDVSEMMQPLARENGIQIVCESDSSEMEIIANRVLLRQALLNLLSHAVTVHQGARLVLRLSKTPTAACLELVYRPRQSAEALALQSPYAVALQSFDHLGASWLQMDGEDGTARLRVSFPFRREYRILVVDDNEGFISLFRRYLSHQPFVVEGASDLAAALDKVGALKPDVVVLDIIMPDLDGWEILQKLRAQEAGRATRVIICSVINDPKLARALGADGFLSKPVDRMALLQALDAVLAAK